MATASAESNRGSVDRGYTEARTQARADPGPRQRFGDSRVDRATCL
jgi:hypothetical protein